MKTYIILSIVLLLIACNNSKINSPKNSNADTNPVANKRDTSNNIIKDGSLISNSSINEDKLIVPGKRIGKAVLNINDTSIESIFGKPDLSDAAMGKAWLTWFGKKNDEHNNKTELDIYTAYRDTSMREKSVQQIRTTSSYFHTENKIHVYCSLSEVKNAFPQIHKMKQSAEDEKKILVYDDVKNGIAFQFENETVQKICTGIFVHNKNKKVTDIYINPPQ